MKTAADGYKKFGVLIASVLGLPIADMTDSLPDRMIWPLVVLIAAYLIGQAITDVAKYWKGGDE